MDPGSLRLQPELAQRNLTHSQIHTCLVCVHVHPPRAQAARRRQLNKHSATKDSQKRNRPTAETGSPDTWCAVSWGFPRKRTGALASHTRAPHAMSYRRPGIIHLEALTFRVESDGQILQYLKGSTCGLLRCEIPSSLRGSS